MEGLVSERFRTAMDEQKVTPISQPQVQEMMLVDGQPLTFKAVFEVLPEIDLAGYDTVRVARPDSALTDEEYTAELERALEAHATVEPVEETAAAGRWGLGRDRVHRESEGSCAGGWRRWG